MLTDSIPDSIPHKLAHIQAQINCAPLGKFVLEREVHNYLLNSHIEQIYRANLISKLMCTSEIRCACNKNEIKHAWLRSPCVGWGCFAFSWQ